VGRKGGSVWHWRDELGGGGIIEKGTDLETEGAKSKESDQLAG